MLVKSKILQKITWILLKSVKTSQKVYLTDAQRSTKFKLYFKLNLMQAIPMQTLTSPFLTDIRNLLLMKNFNNSCIKNGDNVIEINGNTLHLTTYFGQKKILGPNLLTCSN